MNGSLLVYFCLWNFHLFFFLQYEKCIFIQTENLLQLKDIIFCFIYISFLASFSILFTYLETSVIKLDGIKKLIAVTCPARRQQLSVPSGYQPPRKGPTPEAAVDWIVPCNWHYHYSCHFPHLSLVDRYGDSWLYTPAGVSPTADSLSQSHSAADIHRTDMEWIHVLSGDYKVLVSRVYMYS